MYYIDANVEEQGLPADTQTMTSSTIAWSGWYLVQDIVTITSKASITNSLFAPSETTMGTDNSAIFLHVYITRNMAVKNGYYTQTFGTAQGVQGYMMSADEGITVELAEDSVHGISYNRTIYAGSSETVNLTIASSNGQYIIKNCTASAVTLTESDGNIP